MIPPESHALEVPGEAGGARLDVWLAQSLPMHTRSAIRRHIESGDVRVNGAVVTKPSHAVRAGDRVDIVIPPPATPLPSPEAIALDIVHEDEHLLVINKPPGLVVHPGKGNLSGTLVNALLHHCPDIRGVGGIRRPGIVHRLDKGTSGLLLVAKDDAAHTALSDALRRREVRRTYEALAWGRDFERQGCVEAPIGRDPKSRLRMAVVEWGRAARTHFEVVARAALAARLRVRLETGRTHQIRVHLAHIGHPILGDAVYGGASPEWLARLQRENATAAAVVRRVRRPMLHAAAIAFTHPITGEAMEFHAPAPADFDEAALALGL